jgi:single-strand DNA-binding protein
MANLNKVFLMGNITKDLQLTYLPSQTPVCDFGLAMNRTWTGQDGVKKEEVTFVDCACFGKTAEILAKYKKKGDPLFVEGRLKLDQWEAQDGTKRSKMRVIVENFQFLNRGAPGSYGAPQSEGHANAPAEYSGEPDAPRSAPPPQAAPVRQAYAPRPAGRPAPVARPAPAPNYDAGDVPSVPEDDAPQIKEDDIPF